MGDVLVWPYDHQRALFAVNAAQIVDVRTSLEGRAEYLFKVAQITLIVAS